MGIVERWWLLYLIYSYIFLGRESVLVLRILIAIWFFVFVSFKLFYVYCRILKLRLGGGYFFCNLFWDKKVKC